MEQRDGPLFEALARVAERRLYSFNAESVDVCNGEQKDKPLFKAMVRVAERRLGDFNAQVLAITAWAFATWAFSR